MAKIKLTKNEQKKQKDSLKRFRRYLPTLLLKKQQLLIEIRLIEQRQRTLAERTESGNIAGVEIPVFKGATFRFMPYDLFSTPLWIDSALERLSTMMLLDLEIKVMDDQAQRLRSELRVTTQRVNLFEKVKIPEAIENIRKIGIYLGDQQTAQVVRGKIAKKNLERASS